MYNCKHICAYMHSFHLHVLYTVWCLSKLYVDKIFVKTTCKYFLRKEKTQMGTRVRARVFNAGLLARSHFASRRPCDRPTRSRFPWFSLVPEQMLCWYPNSTLHCMLLMQPPNFNTKNFALMYTSWCRIEILRMESLNAEWTRHRTYWLNGRWS
jgi:hypothetical protein